MPNNPTTDTVLLTAVSVIGQGYPTPNTQVSAGNIYIQNLSGMITAGAFPAVHLSAGTQTYTRNSRATYIGLLVAFVDYYNRWDTQPQTLDQIRAAIASDLETWKANLESNDSLTYNAQATAVSIPVIELAPYNGEITTTAPGYSLVWRRMTLRMNILPYDV